MKLGQFFSLQIIHVLQSDNAIWLSSDWRVNLCDRHASHYLGVLTWKLFKCRKRTETWELVKGDVLDGLKYSSRQSPRRVLIYYVERAWETEVKRRLMRHFALNSQILRKSLFSNKKVIFQKRSFWRRFWWPAALYFIACRSHALIMS